MSATAKDFVYHVKVDSANAEVKQEPTVSMETLKSYQAEVAKYLTQKK